ncbi:hypothetical protein BIY24_11785 [Halobacteriovorax marinus]|uniref:hypothetical protein n=1 Tax=Halobacteriovorax marinus TaxID=97084 RepID=UPI000BC3261D|nr:hypothetical protein [Halobacteriovorax marinus]ATH08600.1 hypothetical protein BIY24_11785 [Halobacteriovorax marinus]
MKFIFTILVLLSTSANATEELLFSNEKKQVKKITLSELKSRFKPQKVSVFNPYTLKPEIYNAFDMKEIFNFIYGKKWRDSFAFRVSTKDKYSPLIETYKFNERKSYLAYSRSDNKEFVSLTFYKEKIVDLAPFYLIWNENKEEVPSRRMSHWPYKVIGFNLVSSFPEYLIPPKDSNQKLKWGYENVRKHCLACHSLYGHGSTKAGELISNNLTKKFSDKELKRFINQPRKVNPRSKMPIFSPKIDNRIDRINNIVIYLRYLEEKSKVKRKSKTEALNKELQKRIKN